MQAPGPVAEEPAAPAVELPEEALETLDEFAWPLEDPPVVGEGTAFPEYRRAVHWAPGESGLAGEKGWVGKREFRSI